MAKSNPYFWYFLQMTALILTLGAPLFGYWINLPWLGWLLFAGLLALHISELRISLPLARQKNIPTWQAVIKTLCFGFTWWLPLRLK